MVPNSFNIENVSIEEQPSKTFRMSNDKIVGTVDGIEAVKQSIYMILNVERYDSLIYSWNYGVELKDLFGQDIDYVYPELKRRISEALMQDDRIISVDAFNFTKERGNVMVNFTVHTTFGDVEAGRMVSI